LQCQLGVACQLCSVNICVSTLQCQHEPTWQLWAVARQRTVVDNRLSTPDWRRGLNFLKHHRMCSLTFENHCLEGKLTCGNPLQESGVGASRTTPLQIQRFCKRQFTHKICQLRNEVPRLGTSKIDFRLELTKTKNSALAVNSTACHPGGDLRPILE